MSLSEFPRIRPTETAERKQAREVASLAERARRDFDHVAGLIAARRPFEPAAERMSDLDLLEAATALSSTKT